jgi:CRISPR/Cas system-associated exonuclease Cas4 (RecB family)
LRGLSAEDKQKIRAELSLKARIESLLEDMNVDDVKIHAEFDIGSGGRRTGVLHASHLGNKEGKSLCGKYAMGCGRALYYSLINAPSTDRWEPRVRRILDTGTAVHAQLQGYLQKAADLSDGTETFTPEADIDPDKNKIAYPLYISGHTDGIYTIDNDKFSLRFGVEIKTINDNGYKATNSPHSEHKVQGTIYQKCLDMPVMVFLYYNKNDSSIAEYAHFYDPDIWTAIEDKVNHVIDHYEWREEPERESGWACSTCKYKGVCKPPLRRAGSSMSRALRVKTRRK